MMRVLILAFTLAFIIGVLTSKVFIPIIRKLQLGQNINDYAPESHRKKAGVPAFGGVIFIVTMILVAIIFHRSLNSEALICFGALILFGIVGFTDDISKKMRLKNEGLSRKQKMGLLLLVGSMFSIYAYVTPSIGSNIYIPYLNESFNLKLLFIPFLMFYYAGTTNAVNLTDGIDGLCTTITILVLLFFGSYSFLTGHESLALFCAALIGCLLAFLIFNIYPAKIIMGDTGSLALGGVVATVAMVLKLELLLVLVGIIYVIETLSVIIQENSIKRLNKKVFKMAPIHHSFELSGWHEIRIVFVFSLVTIFAQIIAFLLMTI